MRQPRSYEMTNRRQNNIANHQSYGGKGKNIISIMLYKLEPVQDTGGNPLGKAADIIQRKTSISK